MTVQFIDTMIFIMFLTLVTMFPLFIISAIVCVVLDIKIKRSEAPKNYLGKGKKK